MKKLLSVLFLMVILTVSACSNSGEKQETEDNDQPDVEQDENSQDTGQEEEREKEETESENTADKEEDPADSDEENAEENEQNDDTDKSEASAEDALKELSYKIFAAQREEDYDFLEDKLSKGASLDKGSNTFTFDNVDYPHEMEFVQTEEDNIEYRYIHEVDADTIIVGFGIVDKKTESSFTIDFEYIKENGEWKMNDMDKNA